MTVDRASRRTGLLVLLLLLAVGGLLIGSSDGADAQDRGFSCQSDAGVLTWNDHNAERYWTYKSTDGGEIFVWLGKTTGETTLTDRSPAPGTQYQVHYQGIPRVDCEITAEPSSATAPFACESDNGVLTWTDDAQDLYWTYKSTDGGATFAWLGKTTGATTLTDPNPAPGTLYQVHYQGIPRVVCADVGGVAPTPTVIAPTPVPPSGEQAPFVSHVVPGVVEVEDFDFGGSGVAYFDTDPKIRASEGLHRDDDVDIYTNKAPAPAGLTVGRNMDGEWLEYTVEVATAASYRVDAVVASGYSGTSGQLGVLVDGVPVGLISVASNGWWSYDDETLGTIALDVGTVLVRVEISGDPGVGLFNMDKIRFTQTSPSDGVDPSVWGPVVGGPYPVGISPLVCDAADGTIQWSDVGAASYWLYRSTDAGASWTYEGAVSGGSTVDAGWSQGDLYQIRYPEAPAVDCVVSNGPAPDTSVSVSGDALVQLFQNTGYGGDSQSFAHGQYRTYDFNIAAGGFGNNAATSIKVADGTTVLICDLAEGAGPCLVLVGPAGISDLGAYNFDNTTAYMQLQPTCSPFVVNDEVDTVLFDHLLPSCSGQIGATPTPIPPTPTTVPPTPTPLPSFTCSFTNQGVISWTNAGNISSNYWIYKSTDGGSSYSYYRGEAPPNTTWADPSYSWGDLYQVTYSGATRATCSVPSAPPPTPTPTATPQPVAPVTLYGGTGYRNSSVGFESGVFTNFGSVGAGAASSIKVSSGYVALLCSESSGTGTCKHFIESKTNLGDFSFDNAARYIQVRRATDALTVEPANALFSFVNASPEYTTFSIRPGVHSPPTVFPKSGQKFIGVRDSNGNRPRFSGGSNSVGFSDGRSPAPRDVVIQGLEMTGYAGTDGNAVIFGRDSVNWTVHDNDIHDTGVPGVAFGKDMRITDNRFVRVDLIAISGHDAHATNWVIDGNYFEKNNPNNNDSGYDHWRFGDIKVVEASDGLITNNIFRNSDLGYAVYLDGFAKRITVENNDMQGDFTTFFLEFGIEEIVVRKNKITIGDRENWNQCAAFLVRNVVSLTIEQNHITVPNGLGNGCDRSSELSVINLQDSVSGYHGSELIYGSIIVRNNHIQNDSGNWVGLRDDLGRNKGSKWAGNTYNTRVSTFNAVDSDLLMDGWSQVN